jgi:peptidyl-prolyl cis-trans isomerase D
MLKLMRKKAQSWMIKVLFAVIIIVFVFFYGYSRRTGQRRVIAEVNGTKITTGLFRSEYQKAYQNMTMLYRQMYGDQFDESMIDRAMLQERILNELIDETLMTQEAENLSLAVSGEELQAAVHSIPAFQVDGRFDRDRFLAVLQMNRLSVDEFQEMEERNHRITKLTDLIGWGGADVSDREIQDAYSLEKEKINLQFVRFNPADYEESSSVDESDLKTFFSENSVRFETPPKVQAEYLVFALEDFRKRVEVDSAEIREEYEYDRDRYRVPKRVKISHILIKVEDDEEKTTENAKQKAEQILEQIEQGADFAALAREHSDDTESAENGGAIGWIAHGENLPEFVEVAFSLKKGEVGPLIESEEGFHIVKVDDLQEERLKGLEEVKNDIHKELATEKGRILAEKAAEEAFFTAYETRDLRVYAADKGMEVKTTQLFGRTERIDEFRGNLQFNEHAFSLQEDEVSTPLRIGEDIYLLKVVRREPPRIPPFEEVRESVKKEVLQERALEKAKTLAGEMIEAAKQGMPLAELASSKKLTLEETGYFERSRNFVPKIGPAQVVGDLLFSLSPEHPLLGDVASYGGIFFVIELKDEQKADMNQFESEKEEYARRLYASKREHTLQRWLENLRKGAKIKIREQDIPF